MTEGIATGIAYIAYARFIMNNPINATAFGIAYKQGEFSTKVDDSTLIRASNEARKIGEAYLEGCVTYANSLGLLSCSKKEYKESPRRIHSVGRGVKL